MSLSLDFDEVQGFCSLVCRGDPSAPLCFFIWDDTKQSSLAYHRACTLGDLTEAWVETHLSQAQAQGCGVALSLCGLSSVHAQRSQSTVSDYRVLAVDVDRKLLQEGQTVEGAEQQCRDLGAHIIVQGPGGLHAYWLLAEGVTLAQWVGAQVTLGAQVWGSDSSLTYQQAVLRLPGSWHLKDPAQPRQIRASWVSEDLTPYTWAALPFDAVQIERAVKAYTALDVLPATPDTVQRVHSVLLGVSWPEIQKGQRDAGLWDAAVYAAQNGLTEGQIFEALAVFNSEKVSPPETDKVLGHKARSARLWRLSEASPLHEAAKEVHRALAAFEALAEAPDDEVQERLASMCQDLAQALGAGHFDPYSVAAEALSLAGLSSAEDEVRWLCEEMLRPQTGPEISVPQISEAERAQLVAAAHMAHEWKRDARLDYDAQGAEKASDYNLLTYLEHCPLLGIMSRDRCSGDFLIGAQRMPEHEAIAWLVLFIRRTLQGPSFGLRQMAQALQSRTWPEHCPVKAYLDTCAQEIPESSLDYVRTLATEVLHVQPTHLTLSKLRANLIGAVRRVYEPGCKHDTVLTLVGDGGLRKSSLFRELFCGWVTDNGVSPEALTGSAQRESILTMQRVWATELPELVSVRKGDVEAVKAFVTTSVDRVRTLFTQSIVSYPRNSVLVATGNLYKSALFADAALARRFHCIKITQPIDTDRLRQFLPQLWAQIVREWRAGGRSWLTEADAAAEAQDVGQYVESPSVDALSDRIVQLFAKRDSYTRAQLFVALGYDPLSPQAMQQQRQLCAQMRALGYTEQRKRVGGTPSAVWVRPDKGGDV